MENRTGKTKVVSVYGNPKAGGFVHGCVDRLSMRLENKGVEIDRVRLTECDINHCRGCFNCLRTGECLVKDDMGRIIASIREADGLVIGASVRNCFFPALYKKFHERLSYILGFARELSGKYVLPVGAVGVAGGKNQLRQLISMNEFHAYATDFLFFRTGIPTKIKVEDVASQLDGAADRFYDAMRSGVQPPWAKKIPWLIDDFVMRRWMFKPNPEVYAYIISRWKEKGLM